MRWSWRASWQRRAEVRAMEGVVLHESAFRLEWMREPWADVQLAGRWLTGLARRLRPDLVHLNQFAFGELPFGAPKLLVAHSCVLSWWQAVHGEAAPRHWDEYRERVAWGLAGAELVAAPTRAMLESLRENYEWTGTGLVLPNARDPALFQPAEKAPFVLSAGRFWDEAKNLAALEAVAPRLPWPVRVAGSCASPDGGERPPVAVQWLGELAPQALARELGRAAIYALPARYEPFGLSVLEAALCGCALGLGDIASLRENWDGAALFVPPDDGDALQAALLRLMNDEVLRHRLGRAAHERGLRFQPVAMARAYLSAYARLQPRFETCLREEAACA
jgi:glycogen(starch) synthase